MEGDCVGLVVCVPLGQGALTHTCYEREGKAPDRARHQGLSALCVDEHAHCCLLRLYRGSYLAVYHSMAEYTDLS
jgi:hypothetical protein